MNSINKLTIYFYKLTFIIIIKVYLIKLQALLIIEFLLKNIKDI